MAVTLEEALAACPLVAILRGVTPDEAVAVGRTLIDSGFRMIEVPLNSPEPYESIRRLAEAFGDGAMIGAGTVMTERQLADVVRVGGRLIVSPHFDVTLVRMSIKFGMTPLPGVATPTELFSAVANGARAVKLFPAEMIPPAVVKSLRAVVPPEIKLLPVGGVTPDNMTAYWEAGANGFGIGSALYKPGLPPGEIVDRAAAFRVALKKVKAG